MAGGATLLPGSALASETTRPLCEISPRTPAAGQVKAIPFALPDLTPARWLWYPSERCLANTVVLFRRALALSSKPVRARGWILGSSRYRLFVNGRRIQFGPAPSDPRFEEADPVDLTSVLKSGPNVIGAEVLYYGHGEGTWPAGKPGFLFWLETETADGQKQRVVSDDSWRCHMARAWRPGQYKRWYLRAFQEEFDARRYPHGWTLPDFKLNEDWLPPRLLIGSSQASSLATDYSDYALDVGAPSTPAELRARTIPLLNEACIPVSRLAESLWVEWRRPPEEYFECLVSDAYRIDRELTVASSRPGIWQVELDGHRAAALTFEFKEQMVGWPYFTIDAPEGTTIDLMVQEAHAPEGPPLLNTHFHAWTRFICRAGENRFETFDFESLRWLQLHIRNAQGPVTVRDVGLRRRQYPWPNVPRIQCGDPAIQKTLDASLNTLHNSAQETVVDGMGRERQQYSGDGGHQLHGIYFAFGETRLPARFVRTFSQGMTLDGYFLDCWPAFDRLARLMERQLGLTSWGPLLDHGVGFNFDCCHFYLHTGDLEPLREAYPRLLRFANYLYSLRGSDGLLPVEDMGVPAVWMDHQAYQRPRHKQCAFNLYAAAMLENALPVLCGAMRDARNQRAVRQFGASLRRAATRKFWSSDHGLFINNLPWLGEEGQMRLCDRSLATALLYDQCPGNRTEAAVKTLVETPATMGQSYPCNAGWRYWALAKYGHVREVLQALRDRWATMPSVLLNNTIQEDWVAQPDSGAQWSHCAVVPLYFFFMSVAGIQPVAPGFQRFQIRPQPADLERLELTAHTVSGPIIVESQGLRGNRMLRLTLPPDAQGELVLSSEENIPLQPIGRTGQNLRHYRLPKNQTVTLMLRAT